MSYRYKYRQARIPGIKRIPMALAAHPDLEAELTRDQKRWDCSRSFLLVEIANYHYAQMRRRRQARARAVIERAIKGDGGNQS